MTARGKTKTKRAVLVSKVGATHLHGFTGKRIVSRGKKKKFLPRGSPLFFFFLVLFFPPLPSSPITQVGLGYQLFLPPSLTPYPPTFSPLYFLTKHTGRCWDRPGKTAGNVPGPTVRGRRFLCGLCYHIIFILILFLHRRESREHREHPSSS